MHFRIGNEIHSQFQQKIFELSIPNFSFFTDF